MRRFVGLLLAIVRRQPIVLSRMIVTDEDGNVLSRRWVRDRKPDRLAENGLVRLEPYVERLFASSSWAVHLWIRSPDEQGLTLSKMDGHVYLGFILPTRRQGDRKVKIRSLFKSLAWEKRLDYFTGDYSMRLMSWWVEGNAQGTTNVLKALLRDAYGIDDEGALDVTYKEERRRPRHASPHRPTRSEG